MGTRLAEETDKIPKPMVTIGNRPILWHIMSYYKSFQVREFIIPVGYKGDLIRNWIINQHISESTFQYNPKSGVVKDLINSSVIDWDATVVETGLFTQTSGRLRQAMQFARNERVFATYGDGLCDVNLDKLIDFHISHGKLATVTAVAPPSRFGQLEIENNRVTKFGEKPLNSEERINGGYFVLEPEVINYLQNDSMPFESLPLEQLALDGELMAYPHNGFWKPMDTIRDRFELEKIWEEPNPPWKLWSS
jgi:glucose-1-phosphate cytidylyltransferase